MGFTDDYTTQEKFNSETAAILLDNKIIPAEKNKMIISNEAYAIGSMLQNLINTMERTGRI